MFNNMEMARKPLTEQVADQISNMIRENSLGVGEKLPNEFELAEMLGVGRGTVREAVKQLVSRNVLEIKRGKGTFVAKHPGVVEDPWGFEYVQDKYKLAMDLMEVRLMVEPQVAELAAQRATKQDIEEIARLCDDVEELIRKGEDHLRKDVEFHTRVAQCTQNMVVPNIIPIINYSIGLFIEYTGYTLLEETIDTHRSLVNAIAKHDPEAAKKAMQAHMRHNKERITKRYEEMQKEEAEGHTKREA